MIHKISSSIKKQRDIASRRLEATKEWIGLKRYIRDRPQQVILKDKRHLVLCQENSGVFNGSQQSIKILEAITGSLEKNSVEFYVYKGQKAYSVIVMRADTEKAIAALKQSDLLAVSYYRPRYDAGLAIREKIFGFSPPKNLGNMRSLKVYQHIRAGDRILDGSAFGVFIEFWSKGEDLSEEEQEKAMSAAGIKEPTLLKDALVPLVSSDIAAVFSGKEAKPTSITIGGRRYPTLAVFKENSLHTVDFPIDFVYTWVDGSDPVWMKEYDKARKKIDKNHQNNSSSRWANHNELMYSLRSVEMYASWVRNIYIVTMGQTPAFLKNIDNKKLKIIDHKELFKDPSVLPVFNSHAIETQLHRIPGLSEHFIYINDDILFTRPTYPEFFFFPSGVVKIQQSSAKIGTGPPTEDESAPSSAGKNARKIVKKDVGFYITNKFRHTVNPQLRSVSETIYKDNKKITDKTMASKFRSVEDIPFTSILMQNYLLASGKGVPAPYRSTTVNVSVDQADATLSAILKKSRFVTICLNEGDTLEEDRDKVDRRIKKFLEELFPFPSRWE
ncbi:MAG: Stealth CR1 domain-containing protein [Patescibacteria group bacterium]